MNKHALIKVHHLLLGIAREADGVDGLNEVCRSEPGSKDVSIFRVEIRFIGCNKVLTADRSTVFFPVNVCEAESTFRIVAEGFTILPTLVSLFDRLVINTNSIFKL
nr:hypothetical protein [Endozoicomonas atrinae]